MCFSSRDAGAHQFVHPHMSILHDHADTDNEYSYKKGVWCARTAWAYWRQALMVEFVNNREETIAKGVAKAIARCGDGVHDVRVKHPL